MYAIKDRKADRHKNKWHAQIRDVPPDVWSRIKAGAVARQMNIGEYITHCVLLSEQVRHAADESNDEKEFYNRVSQALEELGLETVIA